MSTHQRARVAAEGRWNPTTEQIQTRLDKAVRAIVANWPELNDDQKQTLRTLVAPIEGR